MYAVPSYDAPSESLAPAPSGSHVRLHLSQPSSTRPDLDGVAISCTRLAACLHTSRPSPINETRPSRSFAVHPSLPPLMILVAPARQPSRPVSPDATHRPRGASSAAETGRARDSSLAIFSTIPSWHFGLRLCAVLRSWPGISLCPFPRPSVVSSLGFLALRLGGRRRVRRLHVSWLAIYWSGRPALSSVPATPPRL